MSKQDRQGARTVADLNRRYNVKEAMGAASSSLKASEEARNSAASARNSAEAAMNAVGDKVDKKDYDMVVDMLNASNAIVRLLAGRLVIQSDKFTLSETGSVVAKDITLQNGADTDEYSVKIADGVVKINSPLEIQGEGSYQKIDLLHFNIYGFGMYKLYAFVGVKDETSPNIEWTLHGLAIEPVE